MKGFSKLFVLGFLVLAISSCQKEDEFTYYYFDADEKAIIDQYLNLPEIPDNYEVVLPSHLTATGLATRRVNDKKAALGRVLFYDTNLSSDGTVSCASCHNQAKGFADDVAFSRGIEDEQTERNSFALGSVVNFSAYYGTDLNGPSAVRFFWDNRAETAAAQARGSFTNPVEMGLHMSEVVNIVKDQPYYAPLFKKAYDDDPSITEDKILDAIQDFVNAIGSYESEFDQAASKIYSSNDFGAQKLYNNFPDFTDEQNNGKTIYLNNCSTCHSENMGRPSEMFASNGLDMNPTDQGVGGFTNASYQMGTFKVPTLRNVELTAPYMHDGRFNTLEEVVEFYSSGIQDHENLAQSLKDGNQPKQFNFSTSEKQALVAFLKTLTDDEVAQKDKFSNPFK